MKFYSRKKVDTMVGVQECYRGLGLGIKTMGGGGTGNRSYGGGTGFGYSTGERK